MEGIDRQRQFAGKFTENAEAMQRMAEAMLLRNIELRRQDWEVRDRIKARVGPSRRSSAAASTTARAG